MATAPPEAVAPTVEPAAVPLPLPVEVAEPAPVAATPSGISAIWPWLLGGALLVGLLAWMASRRRRRLHDDYRSAEQSEETPIDTESTWVPAAAPVTAAASLPRDEAPEAVPEIETVAVVEPDADELAAVAAGSQPVGDRPWLELMMRPLRAGTTGDEARVEFELTVGNTGTVPARDVRISSWMFAAGSAQESEMEQLLIEPPAEATLSEVTIGAGDGAKVEASMALPCSALQQEVLPVVVADARYTLPDGSEGRISASFAIGHPVGEALEPFRTDDPSGMEGDVDSRLYGEVQRA